MAPTFSSYDRAKCSRRRWRAKDEHDDEDSGDDGNHRVRVKNEKRVGPP